MKQIEEMAGRILLGEIASVLRSNGDTTPQQLAKLISMTEIVHLLQDEKLVEVIGRHVRLSSIGRNEL